ncbi:hypothetical protein AA0614_2917 [Komagataeibacter saccharivorans NRIC 0614]|nr:hypothetical protein AA0614_2917 [Komagataeibacter saccharivorans NRIC 0614]
MQAQTRTIGLQAGEHVSKGYLITTTADYGGSGALFTLFRQKQTVLCVLTAPTPGTDQNVPTSRCWSLNDPTSEEVKN